MIIRYPTGLYGSQIPLRASDSGSITWVVSTDNPNRPKTQMQQFPLAAQIRKFAQKDFSKTKSRELRGDLVYSITIAKQKTAANNAMLFEAGQVVSSGEIEFAISRPTPSPDIDLQHNNNKFDLTTSGLTEEQINEIGIRTAEVLEVLREEYATLKSELEGMDNNIKTIQKQLNEVTLSIEAVSLIDDTNFTTPVLATLGSTRQLLEQEMNQLLELNDGITQLVNNKYTEILKITRLVR